MTAKHAREAEPNAAQESMSNDRLLSIGGAAGLEAASSPEDRAKSAAVKNKQSSKEAP